MHACVGTETIQVCRVRQYRRERAEQRAADLHSPEDWMLSLSQVCVGLVIVCTWMPLLRVRGGRVELPLQISR